MIDITNSKIKRFNFVKDKNKFSRCNKLIARGSKNSSSNSYKECNLEYTNTGQYNQDDIVGISAEDFRDCRLSPDFDEIKKAIVRNVIFITDNKFHRHRPYNIGERQVAKFLLQNNYTQYEYDDYSEWRHEQ